MNSESWYQNARVYRWGKYKICYKISESEKPWLLFIHGFPTSSFDWWKIWDQLSRDYSLITLDMIGFGKSDKPRDYPYSIMKQADLVQDLLKYLKIEQCHILAHDYGDTVVQELIARHNEDSCFQVNSACLLNGGIFPESHHPLMIQKLLMSPVGFLLSKLLNQKKFEKSFGSIFGPDTGLSSEELADYWSLVSFSNGHRIAHLIIRYMKERVTHRERWVSALQEFKNPLGLINGLVDPISGKVMIDRYKEVISKENIWTLDQIGHYPQLESPDRVLVFYSKFQKSETLN
ncbi:MAG: alpha/beta fold hydrolase [Ekhidna sp.]